VILGNDPDVPLLTERSGAHRLSPGGKADDIVQERRNVRGLSLGEDIHGVADLRRSDPLSFGSRKKQLLHKLRHHSHHIRVGALDKNLFASRNEANRIAFLNEPEVLVVLSKKTSENLLRCGGGPEKRTILLDDVGDRAGAQENEFPLLSRHCHDFRDFLLQHSLDLPPERFLGKRTSSARSGEPDSDLSGRIVKAHEVDIPTMTLQCGTDFRPNDFKNFLRCRHVVFPPRVAFLLIPCVFRKCFLIFRIQVRYTG